MIHLCGEQVQKVKNIVFGSHLDISNINGVSLLSDTYIYGYTKINSGRIYLNGYRFLFSWGAIFNATSQYGDLKIYDLDSNIQNVYLDEAAVPRKSNEITYTITADDKTHTLVIIMKMVLFQLTPLRYSPINVSLATGLWIPHLNVILLEKLLEVAHYVRRKNTRKYH